MLKDENSRIRGYDVVINRLRSSTGPLGDRKANTMSRRFNFLYNPVASQYGYSDTPLKPQTVSYPTCHPTTNIDNPRCETDTLERLLLLALCLNPNSNYRCGW